LGDVEDLKMRFDEAFDILVDHCVEVSPSLAGNPNAGRTSTYDNDIWIAGIARSYWARRIDPTCSLPSITCHFMMPVGTVSNRRASARPARPEGPRSNRRRRIQRRRYSITEFGHAWLANADRRVAGDPSRSDTISLTPGSEGGFGGSSGGLVVAVLNAFSAAERVSGGRRAMV